MSPACLATIFEGDNGGATTPGVSATEIRVAVPAPPSGGSASTNFKPAVDALFEHFNRHFEFYGRKLVPVVVEGAASDAIAARALGATVATQQVFGALTGYLESEAANYGGAVQAGFLQEMARNHVVAVTRNAGTGWSDRLTFDAFDPYVWAVYPSAETNQDNLGAFACSALGGKKASHARTPGLREETRRFGVLALGQQTVPSASRVVEALSSCDQAPLTFQSGAASTEIRTGLEKLRAAGATTLVCVCEGLLGYSSAVSTAIGIGYEPEWVVVPSPLVTDEAVQQRASTRANFIRLEAGPRLLPLQSRAWFGALLESGSQLMQTSLTTQRAGFYVGQTVYEGLMVLAAGIQGAGPTLTPDTFRQALMSTSFPNPGAGQAPYWQPTAGFGPGDHAFYNDYAVAWWSDTAAAVEPYSASPVGSWCYLGQGTRYHVGNYPTDADQQLFNPDVPCR